jgi:hypothetical protein
MKKTMKNYTVKFPFERNIMEVGVLPHPIDANIDFSLDRLFG